MAVRIFSDSTCDLGKELIDRYSVTIIPLCVVMGEKSYYDGEEKKKRLPRPRRSPPKDSRRP